MAVISATMREGKISSRRRNRRAPPQRPSYSSYVPVIEVRGTAAYQLRAGIVMSSVKHSTVLAILHFQYFLPLLLSLESPNNRLKLDRLLTSGLCSRSGRDERLRERV